MRWMMGLMAVAFAATVSAAPLKIENKVVQAKSAAYEIKAAYPRTGIKAIDDELAGWVEREVDAFRKGTAPGPDPGAAAWTLDIGYTVERNDAQMLSLLFHRSMYTGGAHGGYGLNVYNFLLPDGARVDLPQVLDGNKALAKVSDLVIADLDKRLVTPDGIGDVDWIKRGAGPQWGNYTNVVLLADALKIEFEPYEVAPWAAGPQEVRVPLAALSGLLRKDWRAPVASFDCAKATTAIEKAVCGDAALARLDREVAQAYGQRLGQIEAATDRDAMREKQRRWLGRRDAACSDQSGAALDACLTGVYRTRLDEISPDP